MPLDRTRHRRPKLDARDARLRDARATMRAAPAVAGSRLFGECTTVAVALRNQPASRRSCGRSPSSSSSPCSPSSPSCCASWPAAADCPRGGRARQPRLGIVDAFDLDRQRQLVIVRRDHVEHLLMIGGPNDVVVESNIVRAAAARGGASGRRRGRAEGRRSMPREPGRRARRHGPARAPAAAAAPPPRRCRRCAGPDA